MKFSVITINYNNASGLEQTIVSVLCQKYSDYEYIIIDGASTDNSINIIEKYSSKIDYWVSEKDNGIYHAMNKGVAKASGDYCVFINSGDSFYNETVLDKIGQLGNDSDIIVGKVVSCINNEILFPPPTRDISLYYLYSGTVPHQGSFIKTRLLREYPYDEHLIIVSDWEFYVRAIVEANCSISYVEEYVALFDIEGISTSNPDKMWEEKKSVLSKMFPPRILVDYEYMKSSECLTQTLTPLLRSHYCIDRILYFIGRILIRLVKFGIYG
jgi:glycosyltransferase involved in cell wall biosynthesis